MAGGHLFLSDAFSALSDALLILLGTLSSLSDALLEGKFNLPLRMDAFLTLLGGLTHRFALTL